MHYNLRDSQHDQERAMAAKKPSRREMVQLAGAGALGLAALQRGSPPRKQVVKDPTGTSDTLERAGSSMADLLQVQVALVDSANNWEPMNEVYNTRVPEPRPVRSYFGSTGFGIAGQLLQIDAIAYVD